MSIRINPLLKIVFYIILYTLIFISKNILHLIGIFLIVSFLIGLSGRKRYIMRNILYMSPMLILAFILWSIFYNLSLFHRFYGESFMFNIGLYMTLRLFLIVSTSLLFVSTVFPRDVIVSLRYLKLPYKMVFTLGLTLRHISTFSEEYVVIKEAQTSRGLELDKGLLIKRVKNYVHLLVPLLIRSIENAEKLSLAMDLKLFTFDKSFIGVDIAFNKYDKLMLLLLLLSFFISIYIILM